MSASHALPRLRAALCVTLLSSCVRYGYDAHAHSSAPADAGIVHVGPDEMDAAVAADGSTRAPESDAAQVRPDAQADAAQVDMGSDASTPDAGLDAGPPPDPALGAWSGHVSNDDSGVQYEVCVQVSQVTQPAALAGTLAAFQGSQPIDVCDASGVWRRSDLRYVSTTAGLHQFDETLTVSTCPQQDGGVVYINSVDGGVFWQWSDGSGPAARSAVLRTTPSCP